ncbi:MAG TPA: NADAR family protein [Hyphomonadaceae bacterium]|jgi:ribA/ribD-fused uncharacterized protein|nr:NADAR family protein [Hyphomonadaceae bacterium]
MPTELFTRDVLIASIASGVRHDHLFFWGHTGKKDVPGKYVLSQWWPAEFKIGKHTYATAEHWMMAEKARLFGDAEIEQQVLATTSPKEAKVFGRKVKGPTGNDDWSRWDAIKFDTVVKGNVAKFTQNAALGDWLVSTHPQVIVEASPADAIWGIGLAADDLRAGDPSQWRGENLLGFALMKVRAELKR